MNTLYKKTWIKYFELMSNGKKNTDLRLRDFDLTVGDKIVFQEWDHLKGVYTGRELIRTVVNLNHVFLEDFHSVEEIRKYGHWIIETK
jgi:ASC-1-like (ASCH) protein